MRPLFRPGVGVLVWGWSLLDVGEPWTGHPYGRVRGTGARSVEWCGVRRCRTHAVGRGCFLGVPARVSVGNVVARNWPGGSVCGVFDRLT